MFIEALDLLRCPNAHEETWLVAAFTKLDGRFVTEGSLGCPICGATFTIENGIAHFATFPVPQPTGNDTGESEAGAVRLAAFLNLVRQGSTVVLEEDDARYAAMIANMTQARVIALNPSSFVEDTELTCTIVSRARIPLARSSVDGVSAKTAAFIEDAARALRPSGRLVAPAGAILPAGVSELARDESTVVAEARGPLVQLSR